MPVKSFSPHTRLQDERLIERTQRDFSAGSFLDIPRTSIPENGIGKLENLVNYGDRLVSRNGSREWGKISTSTRAAKLPVYQDGLAFTSVVYGKTRIVTFSNYSSFNQDNIGEWIVMDDGKHERIFEVLSDERVKTRVSSSTNTSSTNAKLRHQVFGKYFHKTKKVICVQLGDDLYVASDIYMTSWIKCYNESSYPLNKSYSSFDEYDNYIMIFNDNGVFKMDISDITIPLYYYKVNSKIMDRIPDKNYGVNGEYVRRHLITLTKQKCDNYVSNRETLGNIILTESGSSAIDENFRDYSTFRTNYPIDIGQKATFDPFTLPINENWLKDGHWTHYSIWGTCDTGVNGTDPQTGIGNNPELYTWIEDIPVMNCLIGSINSGTVTVSSGLLKEYDVNTHIKACIGGVERSVLVTNVFDTSFICDGMYTESDVIFYTGGRKVAKITCDNNIITFVSGDNLTNDFIGSRLWLSDGTTLYISDIVGGVVYTPDNRTITTALAAVWDIGYREFSDDKSDTILRNRMAGYNLYQRLYIPLPNGNEGIVYNGFLVSASRDGNSIYYSQLPYQYEYLGGYHHQQYQSILLKDNIRKLVEFSDKVIIYCTNSTLSIPINTTEEVNIPSIGVSIIVLSGINTVDSNIGVFDYGSISSIGHDKQIMITNEPAIRVFNGYNYSENIASQRIMTILKTFQPITCSIYVPNIGYIFWGSNE